MKTNDKNTIKKNAEKNMNMSKLVSGMAGSVIKK